jgi:AraC-like DNA-binding protein
MPFNLIFIMNIISVFLLIFFSIFLVTRKKQSRLSNFLLAGFLFINSIPFLFDIINSLDLTIFRSLPTLFLSFFNLDFLMGPLIYFYTKSVAIKDFRLRKKDWPHLLPVIVFNIYLLFSIILKQTTGVTQSFIRGEITAALFASHILLVIYACLSVRILRQYTAAIKNVYSYTEKINLNWLRFVLVGFGIIWLMIIVNFVVRIMWGTSIPSLNDILPAVNLVVSIIIIYYGLTWPKLFTGIESKSKYEGSTLTSKNAKLYTNRLKVFMETEKPHLTPSITINELSEKLSIPAKHLSQLVNEQFQQNFFDFINSYRIEEAKRYLGKKSRSNLNISQILYEVGFNSKATFNRAFARHVGMSPKEFRRQSQAQKLSTP